MYVETIQTANVEISIIKGNKSFFPINTRKGIVTIFTKDVNLKMTILIRMDNRGDTRKEKTKEINPIAIFSYR